MNRQTSSKMSEPELVCKDTFIYSERQGAVYSEQDTVDFYIPQSMALLNTKNCYIMMRVKMSGMLKKAVSSSAGVHALIRDITIYNGSGNKVLEQLDNYAIAHALYEHYNSNESLDNLRKLHEGKPSSMVMGTTVGNQYCDAGDNTQSFNKQVECLVPIYMSGILSPNRDTVFPALALGGLRIKINLNDAQTALELLTSPLYDTVGNEMEVMTNGKFKSLGGGGYESQWGYEAVQQANIGDLTVTLKCTADTLLVDQQSLSANVARPAHVFMVGQKISLDDDTEFVTVQSVAITNVAVGGVTAYRVQLTFTTALTAVLAAGDTVHVVAVQSGAPNETFEVSDVKMNVSLVTPPAGYIEDLMTQINKGALQLDIKTYTDYAINISDNSKKNSLYINARNSRAKSIIAIPAHSAGSSLEEDSFVPDKGTPTQYVWSIYKVLTPNVPVNLHRSNLESFDAVHLRELQHALGACEIPVNNLERSYEHFAIGRRLAMPGYSYNCNKPSEGELRLNIDYNEVSSTLMHNLLFHIRRITVRADGIEIVY